MVDQPVNYSIQYQDPFARSIQGFQMGRELATAVQQARMAPALEAQAIAKRQALADFAQNKNPTVSDYQRVLLSNPELREPLKQSWEAMSEGRKNALFNEGIQTLSALEGGQTDLAAQLLTTRAEAERNSGNEAQANVFDTYAKLAKDNPTSLKQIIGVTLAGADPAKFGENFEKILNAKAGTTFIKELIAEGLTPGSPEFLKALKTKREGDDFIIVPGVGVFAKKTVMAASQDAEIAPSISQEAVDFLKANPKLRGAFDSKYGSGAAARVLGAQ